MDLLDRLDDLFRPLDQVLQGLRQAARNIIVYADALGLDEEELIRRTVAGLDDLLRFGSGPVGQVLETWDGPAIDKALRLAIQQARAGAQG